MSERIAGCPECGAEPDYGTQYPFDHPDHYDGVSEWGCADGHRWGRWTGNVLTGEQTEPRYGQTPAMTPKGDSGGPQP